MRIIVVIGARPHVVKVGPLLPELTRAGFTCEVAFTGSRSVPHEEDAGDGDVSFFGIRIAAPRWFLDIGTGTDASEAGRAMVEFESLFARERPDCAIVVGDVSASLAAAISAAKAGVPVVHLDAGLRCGDLSVPEEINRILISRVAAMHLTPTEGALENLEDEGIEPERIHFVGNLLAESVIRHVDAVPALDMTEILGGPVAAYVLGCFHRPENLRDRERLAHIVGGLGALGLPVFIPDTNGLRDALERDGIPVPAGVVVADPVPYEVMLALERDAVAVVTDSSGVQEEACMVCTPCVTIRRCTEQVATVQAGANRLAAADRDGLAAAVQAAIEQPRTWVPPQRWDRAVSHRVVRALKRGVVPLS